MANEARNTHVRDGWVVKPLALMSAQQTTGGGTAYYLGHGYASFGVEYFRGSTTATLESTAATVQLQGQIGTTGTWHNLGAAITVNSQTPAIVRTTNHIPVIRVRATITGFTTSAGAASTAERRVPVTVWAIPALGSS